MIKYGSKDWANDLLAYFLNEILYSDTWKYFPHYKLILARVIESDLASHGFWWQVRRLRNHVHLWKKKQKNLDISVNVDIRHRFTNSSEFDTLEEGERREVS